MCSLLARMAGLNEIELEEIVTTDAPVKSLKDWIPCESFEKRSLVGRYVRIEPLDGARHAASLFTASSGSGTDKVWEFLDEPYRDLAGCLQWCADRQDKTDPLFFALVDADSGEVRGRAALMRIDEGNGVVEVGHILFGEGLRQTRGATEVIYLLARHVFEEKGYRRFEWKCDARNAASRRAALRFGFSYEGLFRQHMVRKGRNRDTVWFSMLDGEWPERKFAFEQWLAAENFSPEGRQLRPLSAFMSGLPSRTG